MIKESKGIKPGENSKGSFLPTFHILPPPISQKLLDQLVLYVDFTKPLN